MKILTSPEKRRREGKRREEKTRDEARRTPNHTFGKRTSQNEQHLSDDVAETEAPT